MALKKRRTKYIFVTGGVLSGLGKGITAASVGNILKARGLSVNIQKLDPYLNVDAGTLNPAEHGECFVTSDGAETDLDLGHYERFMDENLTQKSSVMSGRILRQLIESERAGEFLGKTVQIVPHFTNAIQDYITTASEGFDVHIVEIGGTVGDYESPAFFEAIREYADRVGRENCINLQVVYLPYLSASKEIKTKPAQNATRVLRGIGIVPDLLVARCEQPTNDENVRSKLSAFCGVPGSGIAILPNAESVYEVPLTLESQGIGEYIVKFLKIKCSKPNLSKWQQVVNRSLANFDKKITVGVVAKYMDNQDTYMSVFEALKSASWWQDVNIEIRWIDAESLEKTTNISETFKGIDGIIVPGGFGARGVEGKIKSAQWALKNKLPYLGICLGLQVGVVAAARNSGLDNANSTEINPETPHPVINTMIEQIGKEGTGGSMRLGDYPCTLKKGSQAQKMYGKKYQVQERHRHRYECNNEFRDKYESWGILASGTSPDNNLVEIIEAIDHPFFVASQFHPELISRPNRPHPLFEGFIKSCKK